MAKSQNVGYLVVPSEVLFVNTQEFPCNGMLSRRVQKIKTLMNKLAQLAETPIYQSHIGRLLMRRLCYAYVCKQARRTGYIPSKYHLINLPSSV